MNVEGLNKINLYRYDKVQFTFKLFYFLVCYIIDKNEEDFILRKLFFFRNLMNFMKSYGKYIVFS